MYVARATAKLERNISFRNSSFASFFDLIIKSLFWGKIYDLEVC